MDDGGSLNAALRRQEELDNKKTLRQHDFHMDDRSQAHSESLKVDFDGSKRLLVKFQPVKLSKSA